MKDGGVWPQAPGDAKAITRAITELQYEVALSGYRQPHVPSALRHLMSQSTYSNERKVVMAEVWERPKRNGF